MRRTVEFKTLVDQDTLATDIANLFTKWDEARRIWIDEKKELRNYIFQTSTRTTSNSKLPWKNSTTTPKLCQIRDNLHANYMAALFPNEEWLTWRGGDAEAEEGKKRQAIQEYMRNKTEFSNFRATVSQLVYDWIDYGNVFATTEFVKKQHTDGSDNVTTEYVGPKLIRISPYDIVFNLLSADFESSPKIIRSLKSLGDIKKDIAENIELGYQEEVFNKMLNIRQSVAAMAPNDVNKSTGFQVDGFGSITDYFSSGMVELLEFYGDIYDQTTQTLLENRVITVVDRSYIIRNEPIPGWVSNRIRHTGWRLRPDNLYAQGPLDNLVGMQYRIDHLENLKADVFDLIAHPMIKIKGFVEDFKYEPGGRIIIGDEGDVGYLAPDTTALNADTQIQLLEAKMEEFAGAPRQAMGIRTPGEKTKFEVQVLENAAGRIFQNKISYFEQTLLEPILNDMLEVSRRNMEGSDVIRILDDEIDVAVFQQINKEDITANGRLRPIGARHFATQANMLQTLVTLYGSIGNDPSVNVHISGKKIARIVEELSGFNRFGLVGDNIRVVEQMETQRLVQAGRESLDTEAQVPSGASVDERLDGA